MSNGGVNFGGNVGKVNLNTGTGVQVNDGDYVAGDKRQGETNIAGDMHGDISQSYGNSGPNTPVEWVDKLEKEFVALAESEPEPVESSTAEDLEAQLQVPDAEETFSQMRALASVEAPPEEEVQSTMGKLGAIVRSKGPMLGKALCKAALAGLSATITQHPLVAAATTLLSAFTED
jgi:hypothetical protein